MVSEKQILFEPWNMGDALIAASVALQAPERLVLACHSNWHPLIRMAAGDRPAPALLRVDLAYVNRTRRGRTEMGRLPVYAHGGTVLTTRGDLRDTLAAHRIFPHARIRTTGWLGWMAWRSPLLDLPFSRGWLMARNRYEAWARIAGMPFEVLERFYRETVPFPTSPLVTVHIGAQWRSKQYPYVAELVAQLRQSTAVRILAGPGDVLPDGIAEEDVERAVDGALVHAFRASTLVIVNDSGPMHLAALLRCRTLPLCRVASPAIWLPPTLHALSAFDTPRGYRPHLRYMSDETLPGWFAPDYIVDYLRRSTLSHELFGSNPLPDDTVSTSLNPADLPATK